MPVTIENVSSCKKKMLFDIPQEEIKAKFDKTLDELTKTAQLPGFRPGHAPRRLVERKLREEIGDQVKAELITENYKKAVDDNKLEILREEDFDPDTVSMPKDGPMKFEFIVEVKPDITPPDYSAFAVEVPKVEVNPGDVETALTNVRRSRGRFTEQPAGAAAEERDMLTADVAIVVDGEAVFTSTDGTLAVFPQAVGGLRIDNLVQELSGKKAGETAKFEVTVPESYERAEQRGKQAQVTVTVKSIRRMELPPLDEAFAKSLGVESVEALETRIRERLNNDLADQKSDLRRNAVATWLLSKVDLEVPQGVADANASRTFNQQVVDLQRRGVPLPQIEERAEELLAACRSSAQRDLKLGFILGAIAKKENISSTEDEVQARVAGMAANYGRPADRFYEDMERRGHLEALRDQIRDDKVFEFLLAKATVTELDMPKEAPAAAAEPAKPKAKAKAKAEGEGEKSEAAAGDEAAPKKKTRKKAEKKGESESEGT